MTHLSSRGAIAAALAVTAAVSQGCDRSVVAPAPVAAVELSAAHTAIELSGPRASSQLSATLRDAPGTHHPAARSPGRATA